MIRQDIDVNGYWKIIVVYNAYLGQKNMGFTHTDFSKKKSIVGISEADSQEQFFNTLVHEIKHIQSHICMYYGKKVLRQTITSCPKENVHEIVATLILLFEQTIAMENQNL